MTSTAIDEATTASAAKQPSVPPLAERERSGRIDRLLPTLFGVEPAKCYDDYAKFELADPPLVLSLEPQSHAARAADEPSGLSPARLAGAGRDSASA